MPEPFIAQCEQEPLHLSGAIQGHGTLLVADSGLRITHIAANAGLFFHEPPALGTKLPAPLDSLAQRLDPVAGSNIRKPSAFHGLQGWMDATLTRNGKDSLILELTPVDHFELPPCSTHYRVPQSVPEVDKLRSDLAGLVLAMSGFQRVMIYLFREDGDGEVVAEARADAAIGSYLGLRFPASDVPMIARRLYLLNPWRLIPDAAAPPVPLLGARPDDTPDLACSDLRSASPVHCLYLANMGVRASLSFPLTKSGALLGLVACHHDSPRALPMLLLEAIAREVRSHALAVSAFQIQQRMLIVDRLNLRFACVRQMLEINPNLLEVWPALGEWLCREFRADGAWFHFGGRSEAFGIVPHPTAREAIDARFRARADPSLWMCESLRREAPELDCGPVAGCLAIGLPVSEAGRLTIFLSRKEHIHEVAWGGNPDKPLEPGPCDSITPRRSFEKWIEKRTAHCRPWEKEAQLLALTLRTHLPAISYHV